MAEWADAGKGWFGNKIPVLYVMGKWDREICPICRLFTVFKYIKKLSRSYNKRFLRKMFDISCNKISVITALFQNDLIEGQIFHIWKNHSGRTGLNQHTVLFDGRE